MLLYPTASDSFNNKRMCTIQCEFNICDFKSALMMFFVFYSQTHLKLLLICICLTQWAEINWSQVAIANYSQHTACEKKIMIGKHQISPSFYNLDKDGTNYYLRFKSRWNIWKHLQYSNLGCWSVTHSLILFQIIFYHLINWFHGFCP